MSVISPKPFAETELDQLSCCNIRRQHQQWLFLVQGLPAVLSGPSLLRVDEFVRPVKPVSKSAHPVRRSNGAP